MDLITAATVSPTFNFISLALRASHFSFVLAKTAPVNSAALSLLRCKITMRPGLLIFAFLLAIPALGQENYGELHVRVTDPSGLGLKAAVELSSEAIRD